MTEDREQSDVTVLGAPDRGRFEVRVDGSLAGFADYERRDGRIVFTHTEVDDAYEGRGLGSALASGALDSAREDGTRVVPLCSFIAGYIDRHDEYADLVDHEMMATIDRG